MSSPEENRGEPGRRTGSSGHRTVLHVVMVVGLLGVTTAGAAFVSTLDDSASRTPLDMPSYAPAPSERLVPERTVPERLVPERPPSELDHTPLDAAVVDWISGLQSAVAGDPGFGAVAISEDRATVTVTWFGEPSATLREQVDAAPADLRVVIQAAAYSPAELQGLVQDVMRPGLLPDVPVSVTVTGEIVPLAGRW